MSSIIIPANILYDKKISSTAKLIYGEIATYIAWSNGDKKFYNLTNKQLARDFGLSSDRISRLISELIKGGYLQSHTVQIEAFPGADYTIAERRLTC